MKAGARLLTLTALISMISLHVRGQDCIVLDSNSDFQKSQLCSPVEVVKWEVTFTGVNDAGTPVSIHFDWDDGSSVTQPAGEGPDGTFSAIATHTYVSEDVRCNYNAKATLIVNGESCEASKVETVVTVWDTDDNNGGNVNASPDVYPVCIGNGATMHFNDDTKYNCVPPQEDDSRNESTRWIQWVYGTKNTMSSGTPVSVDGYTGPWPYVTPVIELPGPIWGSDEESLPITVASDNLIGEEFEVELRYWNYCNKYPEGKPPEIDRSRIRIVGLPDPTIDPVAPLCEFDNNITLAAEDGGGIWSGPGIVDAAAGTFSPTVAGSGVHIIAYNITDGNSCSASDTVAIQVEDAPDATVTDVDPFCIYNAAYDLEAATTDGTWSGPGILNAATGVFDPSAAGLGRHQVAFTTLPDLNGCIGTDTAELVVVGIPNASFLTSDSAWCLQEDNQSLAEILISGTDSSSFDLIININGINDTVRNLSKGIYQRMLDNQPGTNEYRLVKVIEYHGSNSCEQALIDALVMQVYPLPELTLISEYDDLCSPVDVRFITSEGYNLYSWDFGDGVSFETGNNEALHTYLFNYADHLVDLGDTVIFTSHDTTYNFSLFVESTNGCFDSITAEIPVYPSPVANFFVEPQILNFPDSVVRLSNLTSVGVWDYEWNFGDSKVSELEEPGSHSYSDLFGTFDIQLVVSGQFCSDTAVKQVQILPPPPAALFEPDTVGCPPLTVNFSNSSIYTDTYIWDFDDGTFSSASNPTHVFFDNRDHHVTMAAFGPSGSDTTERIVSVYTPPQAIFDVYPRQARNLKQTFKFSNKTVNGSYYLWDFGDGNTSPANEPSHIYGEEGSYTVTLYAWSENDCVDTLVQEDLIEVIAGEGSINFPTAFVFDPASKGGNWEELPQEKINTVFRPAVVNVKEFRMYIYTRWGEKIFESNDLSIGWDGYIRNGEVAKEGVYLWKAWVKYIDGEEEILAGDITFLH